MTMPTIANRFSGTHPPATPEDERPPQSGSPHVAHPSARLPPDSTAFKEILEDAGIQGLFESLDNFVKLPFAIVDLRGQVLLASRWQGICTYFHRPEPGTFKRCIESAEALADELRSGARYVRHECLNGLVDYAAPLQVDDQHVANLVIGQFLTHKPDEARFRRQAQEFGFDVTAYLAALDEVPIVEPAKMPVILNLLWGLTSLITRLAVDRKRAQDAQADYERLFHNMVNAVMVIQVLYDDKGKPFDHRIVRANTAFERMTGISIDSELGKTGKEMEFRWPPDVLARLYRVAMTGEPIQYERFNPMLGRYFETRVFSPKRGQFAHVFTDTTDRRLSEERLTQLNRQLRVITACNELLIHSTEEQSLLDGICEVICRQGGYRMAWIGYAEQDAAHTVRRVAVAGVGNEYLTEVKITWADDPFGRGPTGTAIRTGRVVYAQDYSSDEHVAVWKNAAMKHNLRSSIALPLKNRESGIVLGALTIYSSQINAFIAEEVQLLSEFADNLTYGIDVLRTRLARTRAEENLGKMLDDTMVTMSKIVELRDPYTAGHQQRVAALAVAIATQMNLECRRVEALRMAAIVHDIGKIGVPSEILSKTGRLSDEEMRLIRTHAQRGYEIVRNMNFLPEAAQTIWQHHERWDGSGYPRGLKGTEIQLEARIVAVADVVEAMSAHRPYRAALGIDAALAEVLRNAGRFYDPDVSRACVAVFRENEFRFPTDALISGSV